MKKFLLVFFNFAATEMIILAVSILFLTVVGSITGSEAAEFTSLFGAEGLSYRAVWQMFLCTLGVTLLSKLFNSEYMARRFILLWRIIFMVAAILVVTVTCIIVFEWFPVTLISAWVGFGVSFGLCFTASTAVMVIKTRLDGRRYDKLLEKYKQGRKQEK